MTVYDFVMTDAEGAEVSLADYKGKVLVIEADDLDFENRPEDFAFITDKIDAELYGLFPDIK